MVNQPGGLVISEVMSEQPLDPLKNLDWKGLKLDGWGIYPAFVEPGENEQQEKISENILDKNSEKPVTPILKRINDISGIHIWDEDFQQIYEKLWEINSGDDVILKTIDALDKTWIDKKTKEILSIIFNQIWKNNDDRLKESKEWEVALPEEFKGNKLLENDKYKDIVDLLAKNYISFPDRDNWDANFEKDLQMSIETTVNKITYWKNLPKTTWFTYAMNEIHSGDLEIQLEALNYIYSWVNTNEWMKWAKSKKTFNKMKWEHIKTKAKYYDFKIEQIKDQINNTFDNTEKNRLEWIVEQLKKDKEKDDFEWEVFSWDISKESVWEDLFNLKETT